MEKELQKSEEEISVKTNIKRFFKEYLMLKRPILEAQLSIVNKQSVSLSPKLLDVFSHLLYYSYIYRSLPENERWKAVFDYDRKIEIREALDIKDERQLNTYFTTLRRMKLLNGRSINRHFLFYPEDNYKLIFNFSVDFPEKNVENGQ